ncbi:MAG TPA: hypothetical protein VJZ77_14685 [Blastocatellia bacterium]|nr:hypothetical protein [Blastocatellia bacterium]
MFTLLKAGLKSLLIFAAVTAGWAIMSSAARAQDDPNAQYILIQSGELAAQVREVEVPVEVGVWKLQFNLQSTGDVNWTIITPSDRPLATGMPNLTISNTKEGGADKRSILLWDPRPGRWKIRLSGSGGFTTSVTTQGELHVCCIQFFGRAGVFSMDRFQPVRGARHHAQIHTSSSNIDTIEFRLIDEQGELIAPIKFRQSDYSIPYNFTLLLDTPDRPFRVSARGRDSSGKGFQRVIGWLIRPQTSDQAGAATPRTEGAPGEGDNPAQTWTPQEWNQNVVEGEYKVIRAEVVSWSDEPLLSEKGNPIGIRLKYSVRFPVDGSYSPFPSLYPERASRGFTGALGMRVHKGSVEPEPDGSQKSNQWIFGGRGTFKADVVYNFSVDLVPNYVFFNEQKGAFCLQTKAYVQPGGIGSPGGHPGLRERFEREVMSETKLRYRLSISGIDLDGRQSLLTERSYAPIVWHQSYRREGAVDCQ